MTTWRFPIDDAFVRLSSLTKDERAVMFALVRGSKFRSRTTGEVVTLQGYELQLGNPSHGFVSGRFEFSTVTPWYNAVLTPADMSCFLDEYEPLVETLDIPYRLNKRIEQLERELAECRAQRDGAQ